MPNDIHSLMQRSQAAFENYKGLSLKMRAALMHAIADELEKRRESLVSIAETETNLSTTRLNAELNRTAFQLRDYGDYCESAEWMDIRIDSGDDTHIPPKPDLRKMSVPLGPVVVFGAANFPFAYSTAGGDTACALAAGCSVVVKAHPGHLQTGILVAEAINEAVEKCGMPKDIFLHVTDTSNEAGEALVKHPNTKAVGFTGSFKGGKQLFDWGNSREIPIPVFAEMSSENPVFILPGKLHSSSLQTAEMLAASVSLDVGQFCTNPGILVALENEDLETFIGQLKTGLSKIAPAKMLNEGIEKNYSNAKAKAVNELQVNALQESDAQDHAHGPTLAVTEAQNFIANKTLHAEVFGPYSLLVKCRDMDEMYAVAQSMQGQLTATILAEENEFREHKKLIDVLRSFCGRVIFNGVPTGVAVCLAMQHGGPFPATTDSRFTSVGADGIKRFARPQSFQNCPADLLPDELKDENPLKIWRTVNGRLNGSYL